MVRRSLAGGQFAQQGDLETCASVGFPLETVEWLSLAIKKCEGSMVRTWLKVTALNSKYAFFFTELLCLMQYIQACFHWLPGVH